MLAGQEVAPAPEEAAALRETAAGDDVILLMLEYYAPLWLAGFARCRHHGGGHGERTRRFSRYPRCLPRMSSPSTEGRRALARRYKFRPAGCFVIILAVIAYVIALQAPSGIFALAVQYSFSGYAALFSVARSRALLEGQHQVGCACRRRVDGRGGLSASAVLQAVVPAPPPGSLVSVWSVGGVDVVTRTPGGTAVLGFMPVVPMTLISALVMVVVSWVTPKPGANTLARYF